MTAAEQIKIWHIKADCVGRFDESLVFIVFQRIVAKYFRMNHKTAKTLLSLSD